MMLDGHNKDLSNAYYSVGLDDEFEGVIWPFRWSNLEPSQGVYNFTNLDKSLNYAASRGKKLIPRLYIKSYNDANEVPTDPIAPAYVLTDNATYGGQSGQGGLLKGYAYTSGTPVWVGWTVNIMTPAVLGRVQALISAVASRVMAHPAGEGFCFDEFVLGVYHDVWPAGVSLDGELTALNAMVTSAITAVGEPSKVFPGQNYVDSDNPPYPLSDQLARSLIKRGVTLMLCDVFLTETPPYAVFAGNVGGMATIDYMDYGADDGGLSARTITLGVRARQLSARYLAWYYRDGASSNYWSAVRAALAVIS